MTLQIERCTLNSLILLKNEIKRYIVTVEIHFSTSYIKNQYYYGN